MADPAPGLFCLPPGVDFPGALVKGLTERFPTPEALARVTVILNTSRMQRKTVEAFASGPATLRPRLRVLGDIGSDPLIDLPPAIPPLRRELELTSLVKRLLDTDEGLAPKQALPVLARSLARLLDEMNGEGVGIEALQALDVTDQSDHWQRSLRFLSIAHQFLQSFDAGMDSALRQRLAVQMMIDWWEATPPGPVVIAGSTASRGTTALLMQAVARAPWGSVVLPGMDRDQPDEAWAAMDHPMRGQDHPQYRLMKLAHSLGHAPGSVPLWTESTPANPARNALVSLALRPAPVTDHWLRDGPLLRDLDGATEAVTLVEAPSPRIEAETIALGLRDAVARGKTAALITPSRDLSRQVTTALSRWGLAPDDSAGVPLHLTATGRMLRLVAQMRCAVVDAETLLILLKQALTHKGADRGPHLRWTQELEAHIRRKGPAFPDADSLAAWAEDRDDDAKSWAAWIAGWLPQPLTGEHPIPELVAAHLALAERLVAGRTGTADALWDGDAGAVAAKMMGQLTDHAEAGADMTALDYATLVADVLSQGEVRQSGQVHPHILIWGTMEARVKNADLMILGGMVEGVWPEAAAADPWLNRSMRAQAGLLLPDRAVGLAAHDFQQAIAAEEVWITRSVRSNDGETIPSRWVNRLTNLLAGLEVGKPALEAMRARGQAWLDQAAGLNAVRSVTAPAHRPSPRPLVEARPRDLRITEVETLWRDPYTVYARQVLQLSPLPPLVMSADARIKGIAIHEVMERFTEAKAISGPAPGDALMAMAETVLAELCPWPTARIMWLGQLRRNLRDVIAGEQTRFATAEEVIAETKGRIEVPGTGVHLNGRADRMDVQADGRIMIYDYKTGAPKSPKQQLLFDKQLLIEAAMVEEGAFAEVGPSPVAGAAFLQIGAQVKEVPAPLDQAPPHEVWVDLQAFLRNWMQREQGYTARMAAEKEGHIGDYDHLARYGEWTISDRAVPEDVE